MISIPHHIRLLILNQYQFLSSMMKKFTLLHHKWIEEQERDAQVIANIESNGDNEVFHSVYQSEISKLDGCYDEEQLFHEAMFIMVYSYYESILMRIAKEEKLQSSRPSDIARKHGNALERQYEDISTYFYNTIRPLRNQLCHNNNGTLFERSYDNKEDEEKNILKLVERNRIEIVDGRIYIKDSLFIQETLDKAYKLLIKLADICGYKILHV